MKRNEEITNLANEILIDISNNRVPLHIALLKASRLSLLLDIQKNIDLFKEWAKDAEALEFSLESFQSKMDSAKDPDISYAGQNIYYTPHGNFWERTAIKTDSETKAKTLASYRAETYGFVMGIYTRWQFGNIAEGIFEKKRKKIEPVLPEIIPDIQVRLNSIEQNLRSDNQEDWKNSVSSCRSLLMDLADKLVPPKKDDKNKYINRLKTYISPMESKSKKTLLETLMEEIKLRIEYTVNITQGPSHNTRPIKEAAEDVVLYTYLIVGEIAQIYSSKKTDIPIK